MPRNLEIKAATGGDGRMEIKAGRIGAKFSGILIQRDTYFRVGRGRLKLREIEGGITELIYYNREENSSRRESDFTIYKTDRPGVLKQILTHSNGILGVVEKRRKLYMEGATRIHFDEVAGLGSYIEIEVPIGHDENQATLQMEKLVGLLGIGEDQFINCSYLDLLLKK